MEFVSDSEYITALLLIPIFSAGLFLLVSFMEILERHGEILFINKIHAYTNKDFIFPLLLAVLVGLFFFWLYFVIDIEEIKPVDLPPQPCAEFSGFDNASKHRACIKQYVEDHSWTIWRLF